MPWDYKDKVILVTGSTTGIEETIARRVLAYSVSKGALMTLSRNLAYALGSDGVRVTHFNVGWVLTPNEYQQKLKDGLPLGLAGEATTRNRTVGPTHSTRRDRRSSRLLALRREPPHTAV